MNTWDLLKHREITLASPWTQNGLLGWVVYVVDPNTETDRSDWGRTATFPPGAATRYAHNVNR